MAEQTGKFLTELPELTTPIEDDLMYIVDDDTSKRITLKNLKSVVGGEDVTGTASGAVATFIDGGDDKPMKSLIAEIEVTQSGSGTPSPSNVRPIVGRSEVNIMVAGKNLCFNTLGNINSSSEYLYPSGDGAGIIVNNSLRTAYAKVGKNTDYVFSCGTTPQRKLVYGLEGYPAVGVICHSLTVTQLTTTSYKFNSGNYDYIAFYYCNDLNNIPSNVMIEEGTTATAYEPYNGSITTIPLGRTVYGGTLDVTRGVLTVDKVDVNLSQQTLSYTKFTTGTSDRFYVRLSNYISNVMIDGFNDIESDYFDAKMQSTNEVGTTYMENGYLNMNMTQGLFADATAFKTWIESESVHLVYELATPQTYTLTPEEVSTILGYNNISADTGDVSVVYVRDLNITINDLIDRVTALENE